VQREQEARAAAESARSSGQGIEQELRAELLRLKAEASRCLCTCVHVIGCAWVCKGMGVCKRSCVLCECVHACACCACCS